MVVQKGLSQFRVRKEGLTGAWNCIRSTGWRDSACSRPVMQSPRVDRLFLFKEVIVFVNLHPKEVCLRCLSLES